MFYQLIATVRVLAQSVVSEKPGSRDKGRIELKKLSNFHILRAMSQSHSTPTVCSIFPQLQLSFHQHNRSAPWFSMLTIAFSSLRWLSLCQQKICDVFGLGLAGATEAASPYQFNQA